MATGDFALTVPQMRQAAQMYGEGRSQRAIAQALGASRTAVRSALRHHGVSPRPHRRKPQPTTTRASAGTTARASLSIFSWARSDPPLFKHQSALTRWALRRGRSAIFADTGLGKSRMELAWADAVRKHTASPVLILAPLAVAAQTAAEGRAIGIDVAVCRDGLGPERRHQHHELRPPASFDPSIFGGVVLDESSIIKHHDAKTFRR
jgi:hypothetical protein